MGGDPPAPTTNESMREMLSAYEESFPRLSAATRQEILPMEQALLDASRVISPQRAQLQLDLFKEFGPQLSAMGAELAKQEAMASAGADLEVMQKISPQLTQAAMAVDRNLNPEFYQTREAQAQAFQGLFSMLDPNNVGAEAARLVGMENLRRGDLGNPSSMSAVQNAMMFGDARTSRANALASALQSATQFLPASRASFDPFGRQVNNVGTAMIPGVAQADKVGQATLGLGSQMFDSATQLRMQQNKINAERRTGLDNFNATFGAVAGGIGSLAGGGGVRDLMGP